MVDGISPLYFIIGVIIIIAIYVSSINKNKDQINKGHGDEVDTHDFSGSPNTHKENYMGGLIGLIIFIIVLLFVLLSK
jgi:hypothetical protein